MCNLCSAHTQWSATNHIQTDPHQIRNLVGSSQDVSSYRIAGRPIEQIVTRLNALIMVLKTCKTRLCVYPWEALHPDGDVSNLKEALHDRFDTFYQDQSQMWFLDCPTGYFAEVEQQQPVKPFSRGLYVQRPQFDWTRHWQHFTENS